MFVLILSFLVNGAVSGTTLKSLQDTPLRLQPFSTLTGELRGGQSAAFHLPVEAGKYYRLVVEHHKLNLTVQTAGSDGHVYNETHSPFGEHGIERVSLFAEKPDDIFITLTASKESAGKYSIVMEGPRDPDPVSRATVAAEILFEEGRRLMVQGNGRTYGEAIVKFSESQKLWSGISDSDEETKCWFFIGETQRALGDRRQAEASYNESLSLARRIGYSRAEAYSLSRLGLICIGSDNQKSIGFSKDSLTLWRQDDDKINEAVSLNNIGLASDYLSEWEEALSYYLQANDARRGLPANSGTCSTLNNIGMVYDKLGEPQLALDYYHQAESLLKTEVTLDVSDRRKLAKVINNIGFAYATLGDFELALDRYDEALAVARATDDVEDELTLLVGMGRALTADGKPLEALRCFQPALEKVRLLRDQWGDFAVWGEANALSYMGHANAVLGRLGTANEQYNEALDSFKKLGDREGQAIVLTRIGALSSQQHNEQKALISYKRALDLWLKIKDPRGQAAALFGVARVRHAMGNIVEARSDAEAALERVEMLRTRVVSGELRTSYLASVRDYYDLDIDLLMQLHKTDPSAGYDERALKISEKARARSFLESLGEVGKEIRVGVDPKLLELEQSNRRRFEAKLLTLKDKKTDTESAQIDNEIKALIKERKDIDEKIRIQSPRYATLIQPQPIEVSEIQTKLLDSETILLEYALGEQRSYLWLVSVSQIKSYELPGRAVIEASARHLYSLVSSAETIFPRGKALYWQKAAALSQMILGPVAREIGDKRLLIVAEGALQYVPFTALPIPRTASGKLSRTAPSIPLIAEHDVISLPSVSVAAALRAELATRKPASNGVAVFADPVFDKDDERLHAPSNSAPSSSSQGSEPIQRGGRGEFAKYGIKLDRLKNSRAEADAIRTMSGDAKINLDCDANLENAKSADLGEYRIVHFATHGLLDSNQPDLSCIALSLVDWRGGRQDGFLLLNDIYNLKLSADLVVLSACSTALGKDVKGEGLVGLTRGFMYAGAARVMASLWNVDDQRTAELMKRFYEKVLKEHMQPAAALRAAQLEMWRGRNNSPYYWGAFVLQGEWK